MLLLDLFSGIGGFSYGLTQAGMELVGFCEIDKHAHKAFQILHDPEERLWHEYDIRTIDPVRLPDFDCMCFGWPCQDNSIAGKRKGQQKRDEHNEGNRSGLLYEATNILRIKKPKYFVAENVTGLLSVNDGRDFYETIREFTDVGYDVQWQVLNSSAYVPQNRERIFFVGHLRGQRRPEVFPFGAENENAIKVVGRLDCYNDQNNRIYGTDGLAPTLPTMQGGGQEPKVLVNTPVEFFNGAGIAYCLDANYAKGISESGIGRRTHVRNELRIRKLTPLECFRLQSFPDEWYYKLKEHGISDSQLYKMAGNAVTSKVAYEIAKRLIA